MFIKKSLNFPSSSFYVLFLWYTFDWFIFTKFWIVAYHEWKKQNFLRIWFYLVCDVVGWRKNVISFLLKNMTDYSLRCSHNDADKPPFSLKITVASFFAGPSITSSISPPPFLFFWKCIAIVYSVTPSGSPSTFTTQPGFSSIIRLTWSCFPWNCRFLFANFWATKTRKLWEEWVQTVIH